MPRCKLNNKEKVLKSCRMLTSISFICLCLALQTLVLYRKLVLAKKLLKIENFIFKIDSHKVAYFHSLAYNTLKKNLAYGSFPNLASSIHTNVVVGLFSVR